MFRSGYYPPGAENDPNAPYNQSEPDPIEVECCVEYNIYKHMPVLIKNYIEEQEYECDRDDEGGSYTHYRTVPCFEGTDMEEEFEDDDEAIGIPQLLEELQKYAEQDISSKKDALKNPALLDKQRYELKKQIAHSEKILEAAKGWDVHCKYVYEE